MGDGVRVPAFGEHRDADHALDVLAELAGLADRVHHLAQQVFVGESFGVAAGEADAILGLELLDLAGGDLLESSLMASPDSSCSLSIRMVLGRMEPAAVLSSLLKMGKCAGTGTTVASPSGFSHPAT